MEQQFHQIIANIITMPPVAMVGICLCITMFAAINGVTTIPIIFNFIVIPRIEKKVGQKLEYAPYWDYFLFGRFLFRHVDVVTYFFWKYLAWKFLKKPHMVVNQKLALQKLNYQIETATRLEIVMTFVTIIDWLVVTVFLFGGFGIVMLAKHT